MGRFSVMLSSHKRSASDESRSSLFSHLEHDNRSILESSLDKVSQPKVSFLDTIGEEEDD